MGVRLYLFVALLSCPLLVFGDQDVIINDLIDEVLVDMRNSIIEDGKDTLPVQDIDERMEKKVTRWFKAKGYFKATSGSFSSLSSILRTGDATLSSTSTSVTITLYLGFGHMEVHYKHYTASFLGVRVSGEVRLTVRRFSHKVVLSLLVDDSSCVTVLQSSTVEYLDGVEVELSGFGPLDWSFEKLAERLLIRFKDDYQHLVEDKITKYLQNVISKRNICNLFI